MSTKSFIIASCCLLAATACAPQAELVKLQTDLNQVREETKTLRARNIDIQKHLDTDLHDLQAMQRRLETIDTNIKGTVDAQKLMADYGAKTDQITTDIQLLQGKIEENNFRLAELAQKIDDRGVKLAELSARMDVLDGKVRMLSTGTGTLISATSTTGAEKQTAKTIEPSEAYRQAKSDYDKGNFELALAGFQNYITQFPDTSQTDKAQYWVGECYYSLKEWRKAVDAFAKVVSTYPKSDKVAGAKLKIGLSYLNEKNHSKAKEYLNKVIKEYPGSNEAEIAKDRLTKIGK